MPWFRNHYFCESCGATWAAEWSDIVYDDCPFCRAQHMMPYKSDDRTVIVAREGDSFVVLRSPETAGDDPDYEEIGRFPSREAAAAFLAGRAP